MTTDTRAQWNWLVDTYWYVTPPDLPALELDPSSNVLSWMVDQTVWHITGYKNGYFWGATGALMYDAGEDMPTRGPAARIAHVSLLGTVFPDGQVQITFQPTGKTSDTAPTVGYGKIIKVGDGYTFEMQMNTPRGSNRLLHWANMMQTKPGEASFAKLPGVDYSVPEMLEGASYPVFEN